MENENKSAKLPDSGNGITSIVFILLGITLTFGTILGFPDWHGSLFPTVAGFGFILFIVGSYFSLLGLQEKGRDKTFPAIGCSLAVIVILVILVYIVNYHD